MSFSGGVYTLPGPALVTGEVVSATENNQFRNDVAGAFNLTMLRNGTSTATANLPMGGYKLTGLGVATTSGDALSYGQAAVVSDITATGSITVNSGTANGVAYLNGSKVLTTGSALTFDGTTFYSTGPIQLNNAQYYQGKVSSGTATRMLGINSGNDLYLGSVDANINSMIFTTGSEQMRLTSTGLGIGTSSPAYKLDVNAPTARVGDTSAGFVQFGSSATATQNYHVGSVASDSSLRFYQGNYGSGTERMRLDSSGNLGLGVTPSAANLPTFESAYGLFAGQQQMNLSTNAYYNSGWKYQGTGYATRYYVDRSGGAHIWYTAPSGTAGNAISFTQAMTLDASGNLLVGTTSNGGVGVTFAKDANGVSVINNTIYAGYAAHQFRSNGTGVGFIYVNTTSTNYATSSDYRLKENIQPMQNALATVAQLNPVTYTWKADGSDGQGFIAHELQAVVPDCVTGEKDAVDEEGKPVYQGIDTSFLVATLTKAIQEQQEQINQLKAEVAALKGA